MYRVFAVPRRFSFLDRVFRLEVTRTVGLDWVVRYHNRALQLARQSRYAPARSTVTVCEWPDGHLAIEYRGRAVPWTEVAAQPVPPPAPPPPAIVAPRLTPSGGAAVDHPWRRSYKELRVEVPLWRAFDR